jgi:hypothetical protein
MQRRPRFDRRILVGSVALQVALAVVLGHSRDTRLFMAAGYLVGSGHSPYVAQDLTAVFHHVSFKAISTIGYPPPWPLVLGLIYRVTYAIGHNLIVYNLAIKLPVIAANVGLAYLVARILKERGAAPAVCRKAWIFVLLNPLLLYVGAAWGQIDAIAALLALAALALVGARRSSSSAVILALAVCFKPTAAPILLVVLVYLLSRSARQAARYAAVFAAGALAFYAAPFFVFGWDSTPVRQLNAHFVMSGTMSFMTVVRLVRDPLLMQGHWWLLGLAWIPALAVAVVALRRGVRDFDDLVKKSTALVLIFFLTRTWLAETNVVLILPLALILTSLGQLDRRVLTALWVIPLVFTVFNASPLQLLWVTAPGVMNNSLAVVARYGDASLVARAALVIVWQVAGWWVVAACFRRRPVGETERAPGIAARGATPWS